MVQDQQKTCGYETENPSADQKYRRPEARQPLEVQDGTLHEPNEPHGHWSYPDELFSTHFKHNWTTSNVFEYNTSTKNHRLTSRFTVMLQNMRENSRTTAVSNWW